MRFTYLAINFFTVIFPLVRSFENKLNFSSKWKFFFPANIATALFFLIWDYFKTKHGVWGFNNAYTLGIKFFGLPLEEVLFFLTVPFSCTFIYEVVSYYFPPKEITFPIRKVLWILSLSVLVFSVFLKAKAYTFWVLLIGGIVIPPLSFAFEEKKLPQFVFTYLISLLPMFIVNGLLTALPVVVYNNAENVGIRIGTIPVEDFFYGFILLIMNIGLYELIRRKYAS